MAHRSKIPNLLTALDADGTIRRRSDLVAEFGKSAVDTATREGLVRAVLPSLYAHVDHYRSFRSRAVAALHWLAPDAAINGTAACAMHGVDIPKVFPITVVIDARRRINAPRWLRPHRYLYSQPTTTATGLRVVDLPCALIQTWIDEGSRTGRGLILDAIRGGHTEAAAIVECFRHYSKIPGRRELTKFLTRLKDGIDSYLEWLADTTILNVPDLQHLERQKEFWIDGERFLVDVYCDETKTAFEFDGKKYHNDDAARRRDLARDRALATIGVQVIRFTYEEVAEDPGRCRQTIRKTIAARRRDAA